MQQVVDALIIATGRTGYGPVGRSGRTQFRKKLGFPKNYKPKCLLMYEDEVLLETNVKLLRKCGIKRIVVVVNYKADEIRQFARTKKLNLLFKEIPEVSVKNSLSAFSAGLPMVGDQFILLFGDVYKLSERLLRETLSSPQTCIVSRLHTEMFFGKIQKNALDEAKIANVTGQYRYPLVNGLCGYFIDIGAKIISTPEDKIDDCGDIDNFNRVEKWERK